MYRTNITRLYVLLEKQNYGQYKEVDRFRSEKAALNYVDQFRHLLNIEKLYLFAYLGAQKWKIDRVTVPKQAMQLIRTQGELF